MFNARNYCITNTFRIDSRRAEKCNGLARQGHGRCPLCHLAVCRSITWVQNLFCSSLQFWPSIPSLNECPARHLEGTSAYLPPALQTRALHTTSCCDSIAILSAVCSSLSRRESVAAANNFVAAALVNRAGDQQLSLDPGNEGQQFSLSFRDVSRVISQKSSRKMARSPLESFPHRRAQSQEEEKKSRNEDGPVIARRAPGPRNNRPIYLNPRLKLVKFDSGLPYRSNPPP
ncbi:hypothetical protein KM043_009590 [Ampulex compressa]|nr:hypothetical protein KM043_009590 [Ampulex compressa]